MSAIPITDVAAEIDLDRCRLIGDLARTIDSAAEMIEACAEGLEGIYAPEALIPVRAVAAQARTIASTARDSIA